MSRKRNQYRGIQHTGNRIGLLIKSFLARDRCLSRYRNKEQCVRIYERTRGFPHNVHYFRKAERLMSIAKDEIIAADLQGRDLPTNCIWWADRLTKAKGRMDRHWWAPDGGVYLCISMYPELLREHWGLYNLAAGVTIAQILREWGVEATVRWINDVLLDGLKVAGILTEAICTPKSGQTYLIFGLGFNINIQAFPDYLPEATSLMRHTGSRWPRLTLGAHVLARLGWLFAMLHDWEAGYVAATASGETPPPNPLIKAWKLVSDTPGRMIRYGNDAGLAPELVARAHDIASDGGLILLTEAGEEITVNTGEIRYLDIKAASSPEVSSPRL